VNDLDLAAIVNQVANSTLRRSPWVDLDDLKQEGWRIALEARHTILNATEIPTIPSMIPGFIARVIALQLYRYVWQSSSPVHLNINRLPESALALRKYGADDEDDPCERVPDPDESPEDRVHRRSWRDAMHSRVKEIARLELHPNQREAAVRCVMQLSTPEEEAARVGLAPPTIKKAASQLRGLLRKDRHAQELRQYA